MNPERRQAGRALLLVLVLILGLVGAGAANYVRNERAEEAAERARPLAGYATSDLEALADAYRQEIATRSRRYEQLRGQRTQARDRAYFDQQVGEFEKVQRQSAKVRGAGADLSENEASLQEIEEELRVRAAAPTGTALLLHRLLTF
jgi:hypothetical protein